MFKDGLVSSRPDAEDSAEEDEEDLDNNIPIAPEKSGDRHKSAPKKKQKFRYETKLERKITNIKQKAKNKRRPRD